MDISAPVQKMDYTPGSRNTGKHERSRRKRRWMCDSPGERRAHTHRRLSPARNVMKQMLFVFTGEKVLFT